MIKLNVPHIQKLVSEKLDEGLSPSTVRIIRNTIHAILQYAVLSNILLRNPAKLVSIKNNQAKEISALSCEQVQNLLQASSSHKLYLAVLLLATTGIRRSELCGLKWLDIDWQQNALRIQRSVVKYGNYDYLINQHENKKITAIYSYQP